MNSINWLDIVLLLPIIVGLVRGLMRGFISEVIAIVVVIVGVLGARIGVQPLSGVFLRSFAWPEGVCDVVAYVTIFLTLAILLSIAAHMLNKLIKKVHLGWANRLAGGAFGIIKYGIVVLIVVFCMDRTNQAFHWLDQSPVVQSSIVYPQLVKATDVMVGKVNELTTSSSEGNESKEL